MEVMQFSMPESLALWARKQVAAGKYADTDEYLSQLVHQDRERSEQHAALQEAITLGLESPITGDLDIEAIKQRARARVTD